MILLNHYFIYIQVKLTITRERQEFGCPVYFADRIEDENTKDVVIDCFSFEDSAYSVTKKERDIGIQV